MREAPKASEIVAAIERKGYVLFHDDRGYDLNIVGIRTDDQTANAFNDWITCTYWFDAGWRSFGFPGTTDPGTFWREHPMNVLGTAILKPGQYRNSHEIGLHKGDEALVQKGLLTVYRDANRDDVLDVAGQPEDTGHFGIDIHRANAVRPSVQVDKWSAGCQVVQDPEHHRFLLSLAKRARALYGNGFSYTLLLERDF